MHRLRFLLQPYINSSWRRKILNLHLSYADESEREWTLYVNSFNKSYDTTLHCASRIVFSTIPEIFFHPFSPHLILPFFPFFCPTPRSTRRLRKRIDLNLLQVFCGVKRALDAPEGYSNKDLRFDFGYRLILFYSTCKLLTPWI